MTILLQVVPKKIPFFWDTLYINEQNFEVDNCSVCKKDKQGSSIETLPSSFSHLYSSSLQEPGAGGDIPRCQQVSSCSCAGCRVTSCAAQEALLDMCGEEVALYLTNKRVAMMAAARTSGAGTSQDTQPFYHRSWSDCWYSEWVLSISAADDRFYCVWCRV